MAITNVKIPLHQLELTPLGLNFEKLDTKVCFHCTEAFDWDPTHLPVAFTRPATFYGLGCFCSLNCAKTFIPRLGNGPRAQKSYMLLSTLAHNLYRRAGVPAREIPIPAVKAAPSFQTLKKFGGSLTIDEFREDAFTMTRVPEHPERALETAGLFRFSTIKEDFILHRNGDLKLARRELRTEPVSDVIGSERKRARRGMAATMEETKTTTSSVTIKSTGNARGSRGGLSSYLKVEKE